MGFMSDQNVVHEPNNSRYAIYSGSDLQGYAEYVEVASVRDFNHTVVLPEYRGLGLSTPLLHKALSESVAAGYRITPTCSAVQYFIEKHPEFEKNVA